MTSNKSEDTPARVRFAPSPTGMFHVGSARTALFNWLWARHTGGQFILRVEDTDQSRTTDDALDSLMDGLEWLGLDWDEGPGVGGPCGPYVQSERLETYSSHVDMLVADAQAYRCFCTPERLASLREQGLKSYDRHCRDLTVDQVEEKLEGGETAVIRFRVPFEGTTTITDKVRGDITTKNPVIDDFVILKSDGFPTYHLANIVDDQLMGITHVLRGEEWIPSTPKHVLLYQAFGWQPPVFVHVPVIQGKDGKKLSKRHGAMAVTDYREGGLLPEAVVNFVALLGWSPGDDREHMRLDELVAAFSIDRILAK
ncbi:MAG: glutamate--tRNA ligase, partial [Candidatus Latescibacteria bacterium]|nr:glutamate--tRNA ligase [Candidatus Latescibacterota bacterium]